MKTAFCLIVLLAVASCRMPDAPTKSDVNSPEVEFLDTLALPPGLQVNRSLKTFYANRRLALLWSEGGTMHTVADSMLETIIHAQHYGLIPDDYHLHELRLLLVDSLRSDRLQLIDIFLTDAYLTIHRHLRTGRIDPATMQRRDYTNTVDIEAVASLQRLMSAGLKKELERVEPGLQQYRELKHVLKEALFDPGSDSLKASRTLTLSLNMERWRWEKEWPDRYVVVNIPSFLMRAIDEDSVWLETQVIVGKQKTPTPMMESVITSFIIYPYWHVPRSIATKEILPDLKTDADYLRRNNFNVLNKHGRVIPDDTIQWNLYDVNNFPFVLRQREGSENSMGIIKFNFANRYGVYLHDTNSKRLYSLAKRDLSHGCVRVKDAIAFAHFLIREDDVYVSPDDLDQYLALQQRLTIDLRKPIPLKLVYFTAEVRNGVPYFYDDIYRKDSVMIRALTPAWNADDATISKGL